MKVKFKGTVSRDFCFRFIHESSSPKPQKNIRVIWIFSKFASQGATSSINDSGGKFATGVTFSCEYLREFSKKFETALVGYSGAGGQLIQKQPKVENLVALSLRFLLISMVSTEKKGGVYLLSCHCYVVWVSSWGWWWHPVHYQSHNRIPSGHTCTGSSYRHPVAVFIIEWYIIHICYGSGSAWIRIDFGWLDLSLLGMRIWIRT